MKLVSYLNKHDEDELALLVGDVVYHSQDLDKKLPSSMGDLLFDGKEALARLKDLEGDIKKGKLKAKGKKLDDVRLIAPVPFPTSVRDAYAFRQHVETARKNRGVEMIQEFDQFPVFYFTNHNAIEGPGEVELMPDHFKKLDMELEVAIVIGKEGRNIKAENADEHIAGFMIMNDLSARQLQMEEMRLNLGPAKGKDFATVIGPFLVTPEELREYKVDAPEGHVGSAYDLEMKAYVNEEQVSEGNLMDMNWTFAEIIERASYGVDLFPGDVIGSGTVGTGCFLELNGTAKRENSGAPEQWLQEGDIVELEVEALGVLTTIITAADTDHSILAKKHKN